MKSIQKNIKIIILLFVAMFVVLIVYLGYIVSTYGGRWFASPYNPRLQAQKSTVQLGDILDRNRKKLAGTDSDGSRTYSSSRTTRRSTAHVVGDSLNIAAPGAETFFAQYLLGFNEDMVDRIAGLLNDEQRKGSSVILTIDAELCAAIYDTMKSNGATVVINYKTGEILAMVSKPAYDPTDMKKYQQEEAGTASLVNRATMGQYTPGSVFKLITAVSALENIPDILERQFSCEGPLCFQTSSGKYLADMHITTEEDKKRTEDNAHDPDISLLRDYNAEYHDVVDFKTAFAKSCNTTFAKIGVELGADKIEATARKLGFGDNFLFSDIMMYSSNYEKSYRQLDVAWSAVGQYKDIATPLHMALLTAGIANDGVIMQPTLLKNVISARGYILSGSIPHVYKQAISVETAATMQELMLETVELGTGRSAALSKYKVGGKTGTAETSNSKVVKPHAWFVGFVQSEEHPLAIVVIQENAGTGGSVAAPIAKNVLEKAIKLGY